MFTMTSPSVTRDGSKKMHLVGETRPFRDIAMELPLPEGAMVVVVGSSYGDTLSILAKRTRNVSGFVRP